MDFRQIEAFVSVYRLRNFSRAGKALFLTQPTISNHISDLEIELGVKLFDRSSREVMPTDTGDIFYQYAVNLLETRDCAISSLNQHNRQIEGRLEIAASTIPCQYLLPKIMMGFQKINPNIKFLIHQGDTNQVIREIREKKYQVGIVGTRTDEDKLDYEILTRDRLVLIAARDCIEPADRPCIAVEGLLKKQFILRERGSGTREEFETALKKKGIDPDMLKVVAEMNNTEAIKHAVSEGLGVAVVSSLSVGNELKSEAFQAFSIDGLELERSFYLVTYRNRPLSPNVAAFREFILNYYGNNTC
ncbi:LysR family transcriptional regulator [Desulfitobacterium sp. LBE]|uniref:Transcriptional regulator n=2 Tax=root TaxID=1 RepID=A0A098B6F1_DESHA|nr:MULTISPECIES: selenium metabolism-associated LysR family transcriptional regulator [Desulfitobacterium]MEA5024981.1 selenium metabolism-associated LysR family transcriptional regulator [Desulfitobacterium hafniense]TWH57932.1 LysR family transcriptional regulator [Desulfitobacterium sp. LBE]CDX04458.1 Transcriptional regulator [Desulfitobacterium hafniense]